MTFGLQLLSPVGNQFTVDAGYANYHLIQRGIVYGSLLAHGWYKANVTFPAQQEPPLVFIKVPSGYAFMGQSQNELYAGLAVKNDNFNVYVAGNNPIEYLVYSRLGSAAVGTYGLEVYSALGQSALSANNEYMDIESVLKPCITLPRYFSFPLPSNRRFILLNDLLFHTAFRVADNNSLTCCAVFIDSQNIATSWVNDEATTLWYDGVESEWPDDTPYKLQVATTIVPI